MYLISCIRIFIKDGGAYDVLLYQLSQVVVAKEKAVAQVAASSECLSRYLPLSYFA